MSAPSSSIVSTSAQLRTFLSVIRPDSTIYLDLEGKDLSRHGTLTIATILIQPENVLGVVDVLRLGETTFSTKTNDGRSLKSILEDPTIRKCVWDVRNDADALWAHFRVQLHGVLDVQLLENASRPRGVDKRKLSGLGNAIKNDIKLGFWDRERWMRTKNEGRSHMSRDIFSSRPLALTTVKYCENDVVHLPALYEYYITNHPGLAGRGPRGVTSPRS
ncbi:hypothetical protein DHEL01_v210338 [Diaporthe helianthi]|uniref:3'-5' exonuclease domain-containing protein n=1 Tax=Diaporthe helianthi TaxID=158607 RepID=A0A2P5HM11_DIAHE|nr:hypothetical protein DHEL01_v210338 [Diaporthe helianthi]